MIYLILATLLNLWTLFFIQYFRKDSGAMLALGLIFLALSILVAVVGTIRRRQNPSDKDGPIILSAPLPIAACFSFFITLLAGLPGLIALLFVFLR